MRTRLVVFSILLASFAAPVALAAPAAASSVSEVSSGLDDLITDLTDLSDAGSAGDVESAGMACGMLAADAVTVLAMSRPRSFPKRSWTLLRSGLREYVRGGRQCQEAAATYDSDLLDRAFSHFATGTALVARANKALT